MPDRDMAGRMVTGLLPCGGFPVANRNQRYAQAGAVEGRSGNLQAGARSHTLVPAGDRDRRNQRYTA